MVTVSDFVASDYDSIQLEDIKHLIFSAVLDHIVFICHISPSNKVYVSAWVCCERTLKSGSVWSLVI